VIEPQQVEPHGQSATQFYQSIPEPFLDKQEDSQDIEQNFFHDDHMGEWVCWR
jgi:hypothetical protein